MTTRYNSLINLDFGKVQMIKRKNWAVFYPILLGIYSAVGLIGVNIKQMFLLAGLRTFLATAVFVLLVYAIFCWRIKDQYKSALMCTWFFLFFFFYGHVFDAIKGWRLFGFLIGRHLIIFPLWLLLYGLGVWVISKHRKNLQQFSLIMNIVSIVLIIMPIFQIVSFQWKRNHPASKTTPGVLSVQGTATTVAKQLPDVYYIILDEYERDDMLKRNYHLDISGFIKQLEEIGFYVPRCSKSNYSITALSLASSLNMNTLDQILPQSVSQGPSSSVDDFLAELSGFIKHNLVRQNFEQMGYKTVSFQNDIWFTEWTDANFYITDNSRPFELVTDFSRVTEFEVLFIRTTILRVFEEAGNKWLSPLIGHVETPEKQHAKLVLMALDELGNIPRNAPSPKFVFAHIISPHEPYIFDPNGNFVVTSQADPGYPNQIQYLNKRIVPLVQTIIKQSAVPPIIILQGDHGRDGEVRNANFIALYFPNGGSSSLYPNLTPVNIFRLLFNVYFGQKYPLLPDDSFKGPSYTSFDFRKVDYPCTANR